MAFYYDAGEGYDTAARFGFRCVCLPACKRRSLTKNVATTITWKQGGDGSEATK